jgi:hypothetical protein
VYLTLEEEEEPTYFTNILPFANATNNHNPINYIGNNELNELDNAVDDPLPFARAGLDSPKWTIESLLALQNKPCWIPHVSAEPPEPTLLPNQPTLDTRTDQKDASPSEPSPSSSEDTEVFVYTWQQWYINHRVTTKFYIPPHQQSPTITSRPTQGEAMGDNWTPAPQDWHTQTKATVKNFKGQCYRCSKVGHKACYCQEKVPEAKIGTFTGRCYYCHLRGHKW